MYLNIFLTFCVILQLYFTISSGMRWYKAEPLKWYKDQLDKFCKDQTEWLNNYLKVFVKGHQERLDMLSKENNRLKEENEKYRDKLKNLGFSDITLDI